MGVVLARGGEIFVVHYAGDTGDTMEFGRVFGAWLWRGFDQGFRVRAGDRVRIRCEYNNTLDNQSLVEALDEVGESEPIDVGQGEGTLDEMCLTAVGVAVRGL